MTESYTGVIDRIEDGIVVMLLEAGGETRDQLEVDPVAVPEAGRHEGAVFEVKVSGEDLEEIEYRPETERERRERAQDRFDRLSKRLDEE